MFSSSGVKSYVDSNYVPLSATQAPVTGLTDILTPVNLLPNSDFSRSGGYPDTQTIDSTEQNTEKTIRDKWLLFSNRNFTNINLSFGDNSITISGDNSSTDNKVLGLQLRAHNKVEAGKTYTFIASIKNVSENVISADVAAVSTHTTIYKNCGSDVTPPPDKMIAIYGFTSLGGDINFAINVWADHTSSSNVSYTLYNLGIYEGSFLNPPDLVSLDVKPSSNLQITNGQYYYTLNEGSNYETVKDNNGLYCKIVQMTPEVNHQQNGSHYISIFEGYVVRPWNEIFSIAVAKVRAWVTFGKYGSENPIMYGHIEASRRCFTLPSTPSYTATFNKFRLAYHTLKNGKTAVFLEAWNYLRTNTTNNPLYVIPTTMWWESKNPYNTDNVPFPQVIDPCIDFNPKYGYDDITLLEVQSTDEGSSLTVPS